MVGSGENLSKDLTPEEFARFRDYIHQHSGIFLEEQKTDSLRISLITRATRFAFGSLFEYYDMLVTDEAEFKELMNLVTINETSFLRFPAQFEALRTEVVPRILEHKPSTSRQFRAWSAGCSTGEEPYSIAMTLLDSGLEGLGYDIDVLGTDVSTNALTKAKEAVYPARSLLSVPQSISSRFFEPISHGHRLVQRVRRIVNLQYQNLIQEPYPIAFMGNWDVIFCRNVTIYFKLESTRRVVDNFYESLNPGGFLFIGHSETLTSISDRFDPIELGGVFLYRKPLPRKLVTFSEGLAQRQRTTSSDRSHSRSAGSAMGVNRPRRPSVVPAVAPTRRSVTPRLSSEKNPTVSTGETPSVSPSVSDVFLDDYTEIGSLLDAAREASASGHTGAILEAVERVFEIDPGNAQACLLSAYAHADRGDMTAAIDGCNRALSANPLLAAARYVLGIIHQREGDAARALAEYKKTIYIDPGFVLAHFSLANLHKQRGESTEACREYENTLRYLYENPNGDWTVFLGGFKPDLLAKTCERSLIECRKSSR